MLFCMCVSVSKADIVPPPTPTLSFSSVAANPGDTVRMDLLATDLQDIVGYEFHITINPLQGQDPDLISLVGATDIGLEQFNPGSVFSFMLTDGLTSAVLPPGGPISSTGPIVMAGFDFIVDPSATAGWVFEIGLDMSSSYLIGISPLSTETPIYGPVTFTSIPGNALVTPEPASIVMGLGGFLTVFIKRRKLK